MEDAETVAGRDPEECVTVVVDLEGAVRAVSLAVDWRRKIDPRRLHVNVQTAVNAAAVQAMSRKMDDGVLQGVAQRSTGGTSGSLDETPISVGDAQRLLDAAFADLEQFSRRLEAVAGHTVSLDSAGGHVSGAARRGQVVQLSIDTNWATAARDSEIESELLEVLRRLQDDSSASEFSSGPSSSAIDEVNALLGDPQRLLRRLGL
ncbi:hypothetical protein [Actinokineospora iranica]|uniref:hypothetical protein n=1 Tax=Actinokineospora iranica TaxID=1271860 RepID=UPI001113CC83|nr:hypothetical protein [Actinokineospora iranica]